MAKKLSDIKEIPVPSKEIQEQAKKLGLSILAHDPNRIEAFVKGHITLGELEGISKESQYQMAKVGFNFMREGKHDQAQKVFEGLQALDPFDAYFHMVLGSIAQEGGDAEKAEKLYTRSLEINPFSPIALAQRGEVRLSKGLYTEALNDLVKAVQEDPEGSEPATRRARVLIQMMREQLEASKADPVRAARDARLQLADAEKVDPPKAPPPKPAGSVPPAAPKTPPPAAKTPLPAPKPGAPAKAAAPAKVAAPGRRRREEACAQARSGTCQGRRSRRQGPADAGEEAHQVARWRVLLASSSSMTSRTREPRCGAPSSSRATTSTPRAPSERRATR